MNIEITVEAFLGTSVTSVDSKVFTASQVIENLDSSLIRSIRVKDLPSFEQNSSPEYLEPEGMERLFDFISITKNYGALVVNQWISLTTYDSSSLGEFDRRYVGTFDSLESLTKFIFVKQFQSIFRLESDDPDFSLSPFIDWVEMSRKILSPHLHIIESNSKFVAFRKLS